MNHKIIAVLFFCFTTMLGFSQPITEIVKDVVSKFDEFNQKAEALFKILPVPIIAYSNEAGSVFGLAKFNLLHLSKKDRVSRPSKLSELVSFSTKGGINASVAAELLFQKNKYVILSSINYKKQPEYFFGIGNDISKNSPEKLKYDRLEFTSTGMMRVRKNLYAGISFDISDYFHIQPDSNSFLIRKQVSGLTGGLCLGIGVAAAFDSRDNRYNPTNGSYIISNLLFYSNALGSNYQFTKFTTDARKYFKPWLKHVIAMQATTTSCAGNVPFFELAMMGGDHKMRGYYEGAYRDKVLLDAQVEYRLPVWNIFGAAAWLGTGRVANRYTDLSFSGFHLSYGAGIRVRVDSKNDTNLRLDFGFGPGGLSGTYINFAEAF